MRIFLGGTCNESDWRNRLIPYLSMEYFNPAVEEWNEEARIEEFKQREKCDLILYTITPKMKDFYSIAESVDDSNKRPSRTIYCIMLIDDDLIFDNKQISSLLEIGRMIERNGGKYIILRDDNIAILTNELNSYSFSIRTIDKCEVVE